MVGDPGTQAARPQRAPRVNVIPALKLHRSHAPDLNTGITRAGKDQRVRSRLRLNDHSSQFLFGISFPILVKYIGRSIYNHNGHLESHRNRQR